jgi:hypothetical protein
MDDRTLLELAARAAGVEGKVEEVQGTAVIYLPACQIWNPLNDDADALRLAVKLRLCVKVYTDCSIAGTDHTVNGREMTADSAADPCAATRRAIVRAAAALAQQE